MSEHRMLRFGVAALLLVLLLGAAAAAIQQSAWSQGYMMGLIAGNGEGDALSQYVLYNSGRSPSFGGIIGSFFKFGLIFFGLMLAAKFFFGMAHMRRWHPAGGPSNGQWSGRRRHGPPWCWPQDEPTPGEPVQDQPPAKAQDVAANEPVVATGEAESAK